MNLFPRHPLTHRLAVPPLPQGGEGSKFKTTHPYHPNWRARELIVSPEFSVVSTLPFWVGENHGCSTKTKNPSSVAPLGERGDRKAVGEGVSRE